MRIYCNENNNRIYLKFMQFIYIVYYNLLDINNNYITYYLYFIFTVEHFASILTRVLKVIPCLSDEQDIFRAFFLTSFKTIFTFINYSFVVAIPVKFCDILYAYAWNIMDLFIIILACALTEKFKQLNRKLASVRGKVSYY